MRICLIGLIAQGECVTLCVMNKLDEMVILSEGDDTN